MRRPRAGIFALTGTAILLFAAATASAQGIQRWRAPDGALYFGGSPPPGSILADEVGSLGSISSPPTQSEQEDYRRIREQATERREEAAEQRRREEQQQRDEERRRAAIAARERLGVQFIGHTVNSSSRFGSGFTTCVKNYTPSAKDVWIVGARRYHLGIVSPDDIECISVQEPFQVSGPYRLGIEY